MSLSEFQRNYFKLFDLPVAFAVDQRQLGERYRQAQQELHPDRYAGASAHEQRLAVQYSSLINEAYATLLKPLPRALYLLELAEMSQEDIARQQIDGGFLIVQMELREKLESIGELVEPEPVLEHLIVEITGEIKVLQRQFARAYSLGDIQLAATACVKMQYLDKLLQEAEQLETSLLDK